MSNEFKSVVGAPASGMELHAQVGYAASGEDSSTFFPSPSLFVLKATSHPFNSDCQRQMTLTLHLTWEKNHHSDLDLLTEGY